MRCRPIADHTPTMAPGRRHDWHLPYNDCAASRRLAAADLLLLVPATYGKNVTRDGEPNPSFVKNRAEFVPLFKSINKPVPAAFFAGDEYDSGARGELVKQHVGDLR